MHSESSPVGITFKDENYNSNPPKKYHLLRINKEFYHRQKCSGINSASSSWYKVMLIY